MGSKKTKTTQTTTPTVTEPYNTSFKNFSGRIDDFLEMDPSQFVAPASPLQQEAFKQVKNLGAGKPHLKKASKYAAQGVGGEDPHTFGGAQLGGAALYGGATLSDYMDDYQNPYTEKVIDSALADFDEYAGTRRAAMSADAAKTAAFGGSRYGIAEGQLEGELARGRAATEAALLDQQYRLAAELAGVDAGMAQQAGLTNMAALNDFTTQQALFDQATGTYNTNTLNAAQQAEYDRLLQAAGIESNLGQVAGAQELAKLMATAQLGETERGIASAQSNALPTQLQIAGNLYGNLYPGMYTGQNMSATTKESGGFLPGIIGTGLQAASHIKF